MMRLLDSAFNVVEVFFAIFRNELAKVQPTHQIDVIVRVIWIRIEYNPNVASLCLYFSQL